MTRKKKLMLNGRLADFVRRYDALLRLNHFLERGQFVSTRQIASWLGADVKRKLDIAKKQEKEGLKEKPEAVKVYEIELQRADMMHMNAQKFVNRGKLLRDYPQKLKAHRIEAQRLYQLALDRLRQGLSNDPSLAQWFDKPLSFDEFTGIRPESSAMPRVRKISEVRKLKNITNDCGKRVNWLHLKRDLVQREIDEMRPIYLSLEAALAEIESMRWAYPTSASLNSKLSKHLKTAENYLKDRESSGALHPNRVQGQERMAG